MNAASGIVSTIAALNSLSHNIRKVIAKVSSPGTSCAWALTPRFSGSFFPLADK